MDFYSIIGSFSYYDSNAHSQFIDMPTNVTAEYGKIVEFKCCVTNCAGCGFHVYIGMQRLWFHDHNRSLIKSSIFGQIDHREYDANTNYDNENDTIEVKFWMIVNYDTINAFDGFWCDYSNGSHIQRSNKAYIEHIVYPDRIDCPPVTQDVPNCTHDPVIPTNMTTICPELDCSSALAGATVTTPETLLTITLMIVVLDFFVR